MSAGATLWIHFPFKIQVSQRKADCMEEQQRSGLKLLLLLYPDKTTKSQYNVVCGNKSKVKQAGKQQPSHSSLQTELFLQLLLLYYTYFFVFAFYFFFVFIIMLHNRSSTSMRTIYQDLSATQTLTTTTSYIPFCPQKLCSPSNKSVF